jgi:hypothetical protein
LFGLVVGGRLSGWRLGYQMLVDFIKPGVQGCLALQVLTM